MHLTVGGGKSGSFFPRPRSAGQRSGALSAESAFRSAGSPASAGAAPGRRSESIPLSKKAGFALRRTAKNAVSLRSRKAGTPRKSSSWKRGAATLLSSRNALLSGCYVRLRIWWRSAAKYDDGLKSSSISPRNRPYIMKTHHSSPAHMRTKAPSFASVRMISAVVAAIAIASPVTGQEAPPTPAVGAAPAPAASSPAPTTIQTDGRPTIVVMNFESGTVAAQIKDKHGFSAFMAAMRGDRDREHYDPAQLGVGIADMLVEKLLNTGEFRLLERKQIEAAVREQGIGSNMTTTPTASSTPTAAALPPVSDEAIAARARLIGARYLVTGSVTKFGFEQHQVGGLGASMATFGMLSIKRHKTEVSITARVVDISTGEIVASFQGDGASDKGGGVTVFGMGSHGMGGGSAE